MTATLTAAEWDEIEGALRVLQAQLDHLDARVHELRGGNPLPSDEWDQLEAEGARVLARLREIEARVTEARGSRAS